MTYLYTFTKSTGSVNVDQLCSELKGSSLNINLKITSANPVVDGDIKFKDDG